MVQTDKHATTGGARARKARSAARTRGEDALDLLRQDHDDVLQMFQEFEQLKNDSGSESDKRELVQRICNELTVHAQIEEEIFYPRVREAIGDGELMDKALVEHNGAKEMIAQLESMEPGDELYDATVTVLGEHVRHHVREEQNEMFPKVGKSDLDTAAVGRKLLQRKEDLRIQYH